MRVIVKPIVGKCGSGNQGTVKRRRCKKKKRPEIRYVDTEDELVEESKSQREDDRV
jgi:hypothetical protein